MSVYVLVSLLELYIIVCLFVFLCISILIFFQWLSVLCRYKNKRWVRRELFPTSCITTLVVEDFTGEDMELGEKGESEVEFNNPKWRLAGGAWGGHAESLHAWHHHYYTTLDKYMEEQRFAGNDQAIMATTCMNTPSLCCMVNPPKDYWNSWFWFDIFLADLVESPLYSFVRP